LLVAAFIIPTVFQSTSIMATTTTIVLTSDSKCNGILGVLRGIGLGSSRDLRRGDCQRPLYAPQLGWPM
jgi:hypothetical protein